MTALVLPSGIVLEHDPIRSVRRANIWSARFGSATMEAVQVDGMRPFLALEISCPEGHAIACGVEWAEVWHRLFTKLNYGLSVRIAEAICLQGRAA